MSLKRFFVDFSIWIQSVDGKQKAASGVQCNERSSFSEYFLLVGSVWCFETAPEKVRYITHECRSNKGAATNEKETALIFQPDWICQSICLYRWKAIKWQCRFAFFRVCHCIRLTTFLSDDSVAVFLLFFEATFSRPFEFIAIFGAGCVASASRFASIISFSVDQKVNERTLLLDGVDAMCG